jgi:5-methylthioadenosine/S-adenosylhomocysteine deaminase
VRPLRLSAAWVLPIEAAPIRNAAVLIDADGRIAAVGPAASVPTPEAAESLDFPEAVLLPGLVNTHTHLELTGLEQTAHDLDFRRWILSIRRLKQSRRPEEFLAAARHGLQECWAGGVTTIADTGDSGAVLEALAERSGSGIVYHEVFGPHPAQLDESFANLTRRIGELSRLAGARVRLGVSPHAPYTVSGPLYSRVARWARDNAFPLAVHLAESLAESELVTTGTGPFAAAWEARGIPLLDDPSHRPAGRPVVRPSTPVAWLDCLDVLQPGTLCIHAIHLSREDIGVLAERDAAIAHCPVSNAAHGHGAAPLAALRRAGIRLGLGTDSVASVGSLDLFREARAAQALGGLSDEQSLALATVEGARALGLERELGSLTAGKWGDLIALRVANGSTAQSPARAVLHASPAGVILTVLGGRIVHREGLA